MSSKLVLLFTVLTISAMSLNYCEVEDPVVQLYIFQNETQQLPLYKYIRGFNLDFNTSDENIIEIIEPYKVVDNGSL